MELRRFFDKGKSKLRPKNSFCFDIGRNIDPRFSLLMRIFEQQAELLDLLEARVTSCIHTRFNSVHWLLQHSFINLILLNTEV